MCPAGKVLTLCDSDALFAVIELKLGRCLGLEVVRMRPGSSPGGPSLDHDFDLIVVATLSPESEPINMLYQTSLLGQVGRAPLLLISDRPSHFEPDSKITHLNFPFDMDELARTVQNILEKQTRADPGARRMENHLPP